MSSSQASPFKTSPKKRSQSRSRSSNRRLDGSSSFVSSVTDSMYERSFKDREVRDNFIAKKFNKLKKDILYGPLNQLDNKIRKK